MKDYKNYILVLFLLLVVMSLPALLHAQIVDDPGFDPDAPIDGGLSVLIAAGIGYGIKKYRDHRKNNNDPDHEKE